MTSFEGWSIGIGIIGIVATAVLTVVIIVHSIRLGKMQTKLQERQIRIDERPYLEKLYKAIYDVLAFAETLEHFPKSMMDFAPLIEDAKKRKNKKDCIVSIVSSKCSVLADVQPILTISHAYVDKDFAPILDAISFFCRELQTILLRFFVSEGFLKKHLSELVPMNTDDEMENVLKQVHELREQLLGYTPALLEIEAIMKGISLNELVEQNRKVYKGDE